MKTRLFAFILVGLNLILAACGAATVSPTAIPPTATAVPRATATITPLPATVAGGNALSQSTPTALAPTASPASTATQPGQPTSGVGGTDYSYAKVTESVYGEAENKFYIYEPDSPKPREALPLIYLIHGYGNTVPRTYLPWINHLVQRGNIVVYPVYQAQALDYGTNFSTSTVATLKAALRELNTGNHTRPDVNRFAVIGYSVGGVLAANLAASVKTEQLPVPKAVMLLAPGGCELQCGMAAVQRFAIATPEQLAKIDPATKLLITTGDRDTLVSNYGAKYIWQSTAHIPKEQRNYVTFVSDEYGQPPLRADHNIANRTPPNAHNFYGMWKLFDGLQGCAYGKADLCKFALGNTPEQRFMGKWSDGTPIKELVVSETP